MVKVGFIREKSLKMAILGQNPENLAKLAKMGHLTSQKTGYPKKSPFSFTIKNYLNIVYVFSVQIPQVIFVRF